MLLLKKKNKHVINNSSLRYNATVNCNRKARFNSKKRFAMLTEANLFPYLVRKQMFTTLLLQKVQSSNKQLQS